MLPAIQTSCLAATDIDEVAKLINLPDDHVMGPMVAIGECSKDAWPKPGQPTLDDVTVNNAF